MSAARTKQANINRMRIIREEILNKAYKEHNDVDYQSPLFLDDLENVCYMIKLYAITQRKDLAYSKEIRDTFYDIIHLLVQRVMGGPCYHHACLKATEAVFKSLRKVSTTRRESKFYKKMGKEMKYRYEHIYGRK